MTTEIGSEDFGGEGYQKPATIHNYPCSACNGTGLKPQQDENKCEHGYIAHYYKGDLCAFDGVNKRVSLDEYSIASPEEAQECQWENCSGGQFCEKHSLEIKPSSDWKEKEREAFMKFAPTESKEILCRADFVRAADYWLSRIQPLLDSAREEGYQNGFNDAKTFESEAWRKGGLKGRQEERARLIALAEGMAIPVRLEELDGPEKDLMIKILRYLEKQQHQNISSREGMDTTSH